MGHDDPGLRRHRRDDLSPTQERNARGLIESQIGIQRPPSRGLFRALTASRPNVRHTLGETQIEERPMSGCLVVYAVTIIVPESTTSAEAPIAVGTMLGENSGVTSTCA
jgi:hypothetical protein